MARSRLTEVRTDLVEDSGAILWSVVQGEQLEFPVTLKFIDDITLGYSWEAVIVEGENDGIGTKAVRVKPQGVQHKLQVVLPEMKGDWSPGNSYSKYDVVKYEEKFYILQAGYRRISSKTPDTDPSWQETLPNRVFIRVPSVLGRSWSPAPDVNAPVYGFFELRVTEPTSFVFPRTWKPIRGMIELLFSPTELVPD